MDPAAVQQMIAEALAAAAAAAPPPPPAAVAAVGVKLPEFWVSDPDMWFSQTEAVFRRSNVTASFTKYDHVLMKLPEAVVVSVRNLVAAVRPTDPDPYEKLKARLTASYAKTRWQQVFALLRHPDIGDRRPSQLMNEMLALLPAGENGDSTLFLGLFLLRLPVSMRDHLAAADLNTADEMAKHADTLWDARAGDSAVASVSAAVDAVSVTSPRRRSPARDSRHRSPERHRQPGRNDDRQPRRQTPGRDSGRDSRASPKICFYHRAWGAKAEKCEGPCTWAGN